MANLARQQRDVFLDVMHGVYLNMKPNVSNLKAWMYYNEDQCVLDCEMFKTVFRSRI